MELLALLPKEEGVESRCVRVNKGNGETNENALKNSPKDLLELMRSEMNEIV
jgi:hypothetical protein